RPGSHIVVSTTIGWSSVEVDRFLDPAPYPGHDRPGDLASRGDEMPRSGDVVVRGRFAEHGRHLGLAERRVAPPAHIGVGAEHGVALVAHRLGDPVATLGAGRAGFEVAAPAPAFLSWSQPEEEVGFVTVRSGG